MECFNLALLAKQWWRLIQDGKSLCFGILKSKYFPNSTTGMADIGYKALYLWRSLLEGKKVVD